MLCGTESSFGGWCSVQSSLLQSQNQNLVQPAVEPVPAGKEGPVILPAPIVDDSGAVVVGPDFAVGGAGTRPSDAAAIREKMAAVGQANNGQFVNPADVVPFAMAHDAFWPKSVATWLVLSIVLLLVAVAIRIADAAMALPPSSAGRARGLMAVATAVRRRLRGGPGAREATKAVVPPDPRTVLAGELDPALLGIRAGIAPHRRRLWIRRLVRRAWIALAGIAVAELVLWTVARFIPLESAPALALAIPVLGLAGWLVAGRAGTPPARRDGAGGRRRGLARGPRLERAGARGGLPRVRGTGT